MIWELPFLFGSLRSKCKAWVGLRQAFRPEEEQEDSFFSSRYYLPLVPILGKVTISVFSSGNMAYVEIVAPLWDLFIAIILYCIQVSQNTKWALGGSLLYLTYLTVDNHSKWALCLYFALEVILKSGLICWEKKNKHRSLFFKKLVSRQGEI